MSWLTQKIKEYFRKCGGYISKDACNRRDFFKKIINSSEDLSDSCDTSKNECASSILEKKISRRDFIKTSAKAAAVTYLACNLLDELFADKNDEKNESVQTKPNKYGSKYGTIAHERLFIESETGKVTKELYETLDHLIDKAKEMIEQVKEMKGFDVDFKDYDMLQANSILSGIKLVLKKEGYSYGKQSLLCEGLKQKKLDCDIYSTIYAGIADALSLPLFSVRVPGHMLIRWSTEKASHNWETTEEKKDIWYDDEIYAITENISKNMVEKKLYLANQTREELKSVFYAELAAYWENENNLDDALKNYTKSLELDPKFIEVYVCRGNIFLDKCDLGDAEKDFDAIIKLSSLIFEAYNGKGDIYLEKGDFDEAIKFYDFAIDLSPDNSDSYAGRGVARMKKGDLDRAMIDFDEAIKLDVWNSKAYANRGYIWELKENIDEAIRDYNYALLIDPDNKICENNLERVTDIKYDGTPVIKLGMSSILYWAGKVVIEDNKMINIIYPYSICSALEILQGLDVIPGLCTSGDFLIYGLGMGSSYGVDKLFFDKKR